MWLTDWLKTPETTLIDGLRFPDLRQSLLDKGPWGISDQRQSDVRYTAC